MIEIRLHGRGGQGAATAGETLALAAFYEGKYTQSFPYFGAERRGAPVVAYTRFDTVPIRVRTGIHSPNCIVVLDSKLIKTVNVLDGLQDGGAIVINAPTWNLDLPDNVKPSIMAYSDATRIALETIGEPITNMAMLGAFSKATGWVAIDAIRKAIGRKFSGAIKEKNVKAAELAYSETEQVTSR
ncbi:MAG: 2-oxoacid:acceptor oxidoreductase family protein [Candidatus Bathyarchaeota archaeon]|nr:MAG: 2-oxoacid:acceptor oxidoreductase family protein [Candidatus Bathyarchaeota archaeon]